jgi:hypothetical protein
MDATILSTLAAAVLSLLLSYVPGLADWYRSLGVRPDGSYDRGTRKRLVMLVLLIICAAGSYALACVGCAPSLAEQLGLPLTCTRAGLLELMKALVWAVIANQAIYRISPKPYAGEIA